MRSGFDWKTLIRFMFPFLVWGGLLLIFASGRICSPVMSGECRARAFNFIGDLVWLSDLKDWQTLASGVLAVGAALVGAYFINKQIHLAEKQERERLLRKELAARSVLPLMLSQLMEYARVNAKALKRTLDASSGGTYRGDPSAIEIRPVPLPLVMEIKNLIEATPSRVGERLADMLSDVQIIGARLDDFANPEEGRILLAENIKSFIIDTVELHARAASAFAYARRRSNEIGDENDVGNRILTSLHLLGFDDHAYPDLLDKAKQRALRCKRSSEADPPAETSGE